MKSMLESKAKHLADKLVPYTFFGAADVGFNSGLIGLGVAGIIQPTTSALLHNTSTLVIGVKSMKNLV